MTKRNVVLAQAPAEIARGLQLVQQRLKLRTQFPAEVLAQAEQLAQHPPDFADHLDRTDIEFVTIDPLGAEDLDQALHIERDGDGYLVHYAIADVAAWVAPGSPIDREAHLRGETMYAPHARLPLHPHALSEAAASLLADGKPRPAMLWTHRLDRTGEVTESTLQRAMVRNRAKLNYESVQADIDAERGPATLGLLREVGQLRRQAEIERGGISLNLPDQEIVAEAGGWRPEFRQLVPCENWNAQISLLTGFAAAQLMLAAGIGILRVLPPAEDWAIGRLRRSARTLGVEWPKGKSYPEFVRGLSADNPKELAVLFNCTVLFRGAGYRSFIDGAPSGNLEHSALAAPYAHTTAPLRRLVDRYVLEVCHSVSSGSPVPAWVAAALPGLPEEMAASSRRAGGYERGVLDLAEALVLSKRVGEVFDAVLIDVHPKTGIGTFQIAEPAIEARIKAERRNLGERIRVRLDAVDLDSAELRFSYPS